MKLTECLFETTPTHDRGADFDRPVPVSQEFNGLVSNSNVFFWQEAVKVGVDGLPGGASGRKNAKSAFFTVDDVNQIGQNIEHGQVVFNHNGAFRLSKVLDDLTMRMRSWMSRYEDGSSKK